MHYNPITKRYTLGDGVDVNYLCHYSSPAAPETIHGDF